MTISPYSTFPQTYSIVEAEEEQAREPLRVEGSYLEPSADGQQLSERIRFSERLSSQMEPACSATGDVSQNAERFEPVGCFAPLPIWFSRIVSFFQSTPQTIASCTNSFAYHVEEELAHLKGVSPQEVHELTSRQKACVQTLSLRGELPADFDFSAFTALQFLDLSACSGLTSQHFNCLPLVSKASIHTLNLKGVCVQGFDFSKFSHLTTLNLSQTHGCTPDQFAALPIESQKSIQSLYLENMDLLGFDFTYFKNLSIWRLKGALNFSFPSNIHEFRELETLDISQITSLINIPRGLLTLSSYCIIHAEGCGFSNETLERMKHLTTRNEYQGPIFWFSIVEENKESSSRSVEEWITYLYSLLGKAEEKLAGIPKDNNELRAWLSRLAWMAEQASTTKKRDTIIRRVLEVLNYVNSHPQFLDTFLSVIHGAADTCGDRVILSLLHLDVAYQIQTIPSSDPKQLAFLLSRGVWALKLLEEIAREKIKTFSFIDELEVFLAYPVQLRKQLQLPIPEYEMLYFTFSGLSNEDLQSAFDSVEQAISTPSLLIDFLIGEDKWKEALCFHYPSEMDEIIRKRDALARNEETPEAFVAIEARVCDSLRKLTKRCLDL